MARPYGFAAGILSVVFLIVGADAFFVDAFAAVVFAAAVFAVFVFGPAALASDAAAGAFLTCSCFAGATALGAGTATGSDGSITDTVRL